MALGLSIAGCAEAPTTEAKSDSSQPTDNKTEAEPASTQPTDNKAKSEPASPQPADGKTEADPTAGYSEDRDITTSELTLFKEALSDDAKNYEPLSVAMQHVGTSKFRFLAYDLNTDPKSQVYIIIANPMYDEAPTVERVIPVTP
jgi:hypothetical protein